MRKKQAGEILIGLVIATVAIGMVLAYFGLKQINDWRVTRGQIVGGALAELGKGVNSFVTQYHPQIVAAMFGGATQVTDSGGTVIVNNALQPTAAEIIKIAGMSGLGATPSIPGASYKIVLSPGSSCAIQATCNVNSLTYIDKPLVMPYPGAADNIDYMAAAAAVQTIGINGGASFSPNNANLTFQSPAGAPQTIPNPVAGTPGGIVAVRGGYIRADFDEFLRRDGTKSMTGNLDMGANSINNAKDFNGTGTVTAGGNVAAGVDVTAARHVTAGQNVTAGGVVSGDVLTPNKEVVEGTSCAGYASGAIAKDAAGLTLSCQSGSWSKQPIASAYTDTFDTSDFNSGPNLCSGADLPQRSYLLNLSKRSLVFMSMTSQQPGPGSITGIGYNGSLCGYDYWNGGGASMSTTSASCSFVLPPGVHSFGFCTSPSVSWLKGAITVLPNE